MVADKFNLPQLPPRHAGDHGGCNPNARCGNGLEKVYPTCAVRYGYPRHIGEFSYAPNMLFNCGAKVVIQTERGIEIGEQVSLTCSGCDKSVNREQMRTYARNSGPDFYRLKAGRILRLATEDDLLEDGKIHDEADEKLAFAVGLVRQRGLPMKLVVCEQIFGGERIIYYFMSEQRVDFRELVRDLAHEYHTRIEMRQIGHRDEARLVADFEICGRECCCKNFLKTLRPVTMQMAKLQKSTLDPSKVSGRCGRLRCCLRYEHEGYDELTKKLPRAGSRVRVADGEATVVDRQVLTQLVLVEFDSGKRVTYAIEDIVERDLPKPPPPDAPRGADAPPGRPHGERRDSARPPRREPRSGPRPNDGSRGPQRSLPPGSAPPPGADSGPAPGDRAPPDAGGASDSPDRPVGDPPNEMPPDENGGETG
ncbi:MAG: regulatory iron-sulfur-containing complex subunit RicT [Phycisphaerae bacterium]